MHGSHGFFYLLSVHAHMNEYLLIHSRAGKKFNLNLPLFLVVCLNPLEENNSRSLLMLDTYHTVDMNPHPCSS